MVSSDRFIKIENQYGWREKYHVTLIMQRNKNRKTREIFSVHCIYMSIMYNTADSKPGENHRDHKILKVYTHIYLLPITYLLSLQIHKYFTIQHINVHNNSHQISNH